MNVPSALPQSDTIALPRSLREALEGLSSVGEAVHEVRDRLNVQYELAQHYREHFATSPAVSRGGPESVVLYSNIPGGMPVLMGLFGSRRRNEWLMGASPGDGARHLSRTLRKRIAPAWTKRARCQEQSTTGLLEGLPIPTTTRRDAGPYLTSGLVCAGTPGVGFSSVSIHRMRVLDERRLTIWMLPGRDLEQMYRSAIARGESLPISICIGAPPLVYLTSCLSKPFVSPGEGELEVAGGLQGSPIAIARCATNAAFCLADSEIVIEGELLPDQATEYNDPETQFGMPEFLGYMGKAQSTLPVIVVSAVHHRREPIYQSFLGPGKEQSELLALPTEAGMLDALSHQFTREFELLDAHYIAPAGGQLVLALKVRKKREQAGTMVQLRDAVLTRHRLTKSVWVVDEDVDIHSPEDLLWASATRFQPQRDLYVLSGEPGFPLDPSQSPGYLDATAMTDRYLLDLTAPMALRDRFARP